MGQVPDSNKILIIGNGKLASHWMHYHNLLNIPFTHWFRKSKKTLKPDIFRTVYLAVTDSAIPNLLIQNPWLQDSNIVHFSGANYFDGTYGIHPLMTFSEDLYDLETYTSIPLAIDFSPASFTENFQYLKNPCWHIPPEKKAKYHALCVMSGNFPQILWQSIELEIKALGCPVDGWKNYIMQSTKNFLQDSNSLTGPIARKDLTTIKKNISALNGSLLQKIYTEFCKLKLIEVENENH